MQLLYVSTVLSLCVWAGLNVQPSYNWESSDISHLYKTRTVVPADKPQDNILYFHLLDDMVPSQTKCPFRICHTPMCWAFQYKSLHGNSIYLSGYCIFWMPRWYLIFQWPPKETFVFLCPLYMGPGVRASFETMLDPLEFNMLWKTLAIKNVMIFISQ